ncbi:hypothetical protein D3C81_1753970 [compost metagenome]
MQISLDISTYGIFLLIVGNNGFLNSSMFTKSEFQLAKFNTNTGHLHLMIISACPLDDSFSYLHT